MLRPFTFYAMVIFNIWRKHVDILKRFETLKREIELDNRPWAWSDQKRLTVTDVDGLISIDFYASPFNEQFTTLLDILSEETVASQVQRLFFHAPDEGANGTRPWDFEPLLDKPILFPIVH
jgi:hypothetical protein